MKRIVVTGLMFEFRAYVADQAAAELEAKTALVHLNETLKDFYLPSSKIHPLQMQVRYEELEETETKLEIRCQFCGELESPNNSPMVKTPDGVTLCTPCFDEEVA